MGFCKHCKGEFNDFQMKTKDTCNICAYGKTQEDAWKDMQKKVVRL